MNTLFSSENQPSVVVPLRLQHYRNWLTIGLDRKHSTWMAWKFYERRLVCRKIARRWPDVRTRRTKTNCRYTGGLSRTQTLESKSSVGRNWYLRCNMLLNYDPIIENKERIKKLVLQWINSRPVEHGCGVFPVRFAEQKTRLEHIGAIDEACINLSQATEWHRSGDKLNSAVVSSWFERNEVVHLPWTSGASTAMKYSAKMKQRI